MSTTSEYKAVKGRFEFTFKAQDDAEAVELASEWRLTCTLYKTVRFEYMFVCEIKEGRAS